jgi:hypothetical protein
MRQQLTWLNQPPKSVSSPSPDTPSAVHGLGAGVIRVRTGDKTDFWRETFYGFVRDNGHFLSAEVTGDFSASVTVRGRYEALYDQAGLMIRIDERQWIKCGVEFTDGAQHFSAVVTRGHSDWSVVRLDGNPESIDLRLTRHGEAVRVQFRVHAGPWQLARLAYLPRADPVRVGLMCCSPQRAGFELEFSDFAIGPAIARGLHQ